MRLLHCASFLEQQWWMNESKSFVQIKRSIFPSSHTTAANVIGEIFASSSTLHIPSSFIRWTESGSRYSGRDGSGRKRSRHKVLTKRHTVIQTMLCPSLTSCWSIRNISRINSGGRLHCCFLVSSWSISWIFLGRINPRSLEVDVVKVDIYSRCWKKARKNGRIMALRSPGSITPRGEEKEEVLRIHPRNVVQPFYFSFSLLMYLYIHFPCTMPQRKGSLSLVLPSLPIDHCGASFIIFFTMREGKEKKRRGVNKGNCQRLRCGPTILWDIILHFHDTRHDWSTNPT